MNTQAQKTDEEETFEVDLDAATSEKEDKRRKAKESASKDDSDFELEIVDDVKPEDKPRRAEDAEPNLPSEEEIESYSERVQKRIKQLKFEYEEERRHREEAARIREEAIQYAQQVQNENQQLRQKLEQGQNQTLEHAKARAQTELEAAKRTYKQAYESGDADALLEAQATLSKAQNDLYRLENFRPRPQQQPQQQPQQYAQPQQPQQRPQAPQLDDRQKTWLQNNPWFGKNEEMTGYAYGLHERLVKSGVDPNSQEYYNRIDETIRKRFPEEFNEEPTQEVEAESRKPANVVAPTSRSTSKNPRKVKLTSTQVSLAKKLGLTPEQYAAQVLKEAKNG